MAIRDTTVKSNLYTTTVLDGGSGSQTGTTTGTTNATTSSSSVSATTYSSIGSVSITSFGLQTGTDRTVYATWTWDQENTKSYNVRWYYDTGDTNDSGTIWFIGSDSEVTREQSTYTPPSNAVRARFVVKPISETKKSGNSTVSYWTAEWSTEKIYSFSNNTSVTLPAVPSAPSVTLKNYTLTVELNKIDADTTNVQFQVVKDNTTIFKTVGIDVPADTQLVQFSCYVDAGSEYRVRCRGCRSSLYSEWSDYSQKVTTMPNAPSGFTECRAKTATSVYLKWEAINTAETYDIEYTTKKEYFDSSDQTTTISGIKTTQYEKTGFENGDTYFFRLRAVNSGGESPWSEISSVAVGKDPAAPTTWSSTTTVVVGEPLILYWVHNSEDGSSQIYAELEIYANGAKESYKIENSTDEDEKDKTSSYTVDTSKYQEGTKIQWRVRTTGVTNNPGDWSVLRTVDIYSPPTLTLSMIDSNDQPITTLTSFPFRIRGTAGPSTQRAIGYNLTVTSNDTYETVDNLGNTKFVNSGDVLYSRYFDNSSELSVTLSASDINLVNNVKYQVTCVVSMNSGLTAESSLQFAVAWSDVQYRINCTLAIDTNSYVASICPYCTNKSGKLVDDVTLAVYRREFNGKFTEIISGVENIKNTFVSDPHPALDYARYRVVVTSKTTGQVTYYDVPAHPVGGKAAVIQWDEKWSNFDSPIDDAIVSPIWAGSMLKLPYNIDVSDNSNPDVALIEYIGREYPISYHGTQLGFASTWSMEIPTSDKETIYALRRLQNWMGNVYVREPSGTGYWASVTVTYNIKHCEVTIPVTLNITRVEGGI